MTHDEDMCEFHLIDDEGERWWVEADIHPTMDVPAYMNQAGGGRPRTGKENVLQVVHAEYWTELDWKLTSLMQPKSDAGWLDRAGRFHGCGPEAHDMYATYVLKEHLRDLEDGGWVRVYGKRAEPQWMLGFRHGLRLTDEQRTWLSREGYTVNEYD